MQAVAISGAGASQLILISSKRGIRVELQGTIGAPVVETHIGGLDH